MSEEFVICVCGIKAHKFGQPNCFHCGYEFHKCSVCGGNISHDTEHFPHDKDCPVSTEPEEFDRLLAEKRELACLDHLTRDQLGMLDDLNQQLERFLCDCDNVVCENCCWECKEIGHD